jgi:hypothetical protein
MDWSCCACHIQCRIKTVEGYTRRCICGSGSLAWVPGLLIAENWDDHDRSGRFMTRDYAVITSNRALPMPSCSPMAITIHFRLWYVQEVEGIRTDVKVINISYLGMDWYINQHRKATYEAPPVPFSFGEEKYAMGRRDAVLLYDRIEGATDLRDAMSFMGSDDERTKVEMTVDKCLIIFRIPIFTCPYNRKSSCNRNCSA